MSQRDSGYARKERDLYETPEWVTEALLPHLPPIERIWEPACGSRKMVKVLENVAGVLASDISPVDKLHTLEIDFLCPVHSIGHPFDAIITNPPYERATEFCEVSLAKTKETGGIVAMLLRTDFDHAKTRQHLFSKHPAFAKKVVLTKRITWFEPEPGSKGKSPSFNHAWFIWDWKHEGAPTLAYGP